MSDFSTAILNPELGVRYYLKIQGLPDIFLDGTVPKGPEGTLWSAPTSKGFSHTYRALMLDVSKGLSTIGATISRRSGSTVPGSLSINLSDNRDNYLRTLFARDRSDGYVATLTADLAYDTSGGGSSITVDDTSGFTTPSYGYIGRETVRIFSKTGTSFDCTTASGGARDVFSLGYEDLTYRHNANKPTAPRIISSYPIVWHGRTLQLYAFLVDADGYALDAAIDGDYSREIWRGQIQGDPKPNADWLSWKIETKSIDAILHTEVGREPIEGTLIRVPGGGKANQEATAEQYTYSGGDGGYYTILLTPNVWRIHLDVTEYASSATYGVTPASSKTYNIQIVTTTTVETAKGLENRITGKLDNGAGTPMGDFSNLTIKISKGKTKWRITTTAQGTKHYGINFRWDEQGSIGRMLGFSGTTHITNAAQTNKTDNAPELALASYVGPDDVQIPFFYSEVVGIQPDLATAPGYARLGDGEIISYTGVGALANIDDLYQLTGVKRGLFGTQKLEHKVTLKPDMTPEQEAVRVTFGIGFDNVSFLDAILQLGTSTGSAHHGAYDTLSAKVGPGLNLNHFDVNQWAKVANSLPASWRKIQTFISKPVKLAELLAQWLMPLNLYVTARTTSAGTYQIVVDRVIPALESEPLSATIGTSQLDATDPAEWQDGNQSIINRLAIDYRWNVLKESNQDGYKLVATDDDSEYDYGVRGSLEMKLRGYPWDPNEAIQNIFPIAGGIFARYGKPYDLLRLHVSDRSGWLLAPGQVLTITVPGAPAPDGSAGITAKDAVIVGVSHKYWDPRGAVGSEVTVVLERYYRTSTYVPSGRVASYDAGTPSVTLTGTYYAATGDTDASHFDVGDEVRIYNLGDVSTIDVVTIVSKAGNVLTLDAALVNCTPGSNTVITHATYDVVQDSQKKHVYQATLSEADTNAFRYV